MLPDLVYGELGPVGDVRVLCGLVLLLHHLHALQELLDEAQGAVVTARQEQALKGKIVKTSGTRTYRLLHEVLVERLLVPEALVDLLDELLLLGCVLGELVHFYFIFD